MTHPRTVYIAKHATYVLDSDGSLLAVAPAGPGTEPLTSTRHALGELHRIYPNTVQLIGDWFCFLVSVMEAAHSFGRPLLWPGDEVRLRSPTLDQVVKL